MPASILITPMSPIFIGKLSLQPGAKGTETFIAPAEPGEYFVACSAMTHLEDGMVGKLIVK